MFRLVGLAVALFLAAPEAWAADAARRNADDPDLLAAVLLALTDRGDKRAEPLAARLRAEWVDPPPTIRIALAHQAECRYIGAWGRT